MRMRAPALCFVLLMSASCAGLHPWGSGGTTVTSDGSVSDSPADLGNEVTRLTNEARAQSGIPLLKTDPRLTEAARLHAIQMADRQLLEHTIAGAKYPTMDSRLQAAGYVYAWAAENIAWNSSTPRSVVNGWMSSSGHRANILDPNLTQTGVWVARSSRGEPYWIQVFGRPR